MGTPNPKITRGRSLFFKIFSFADSKERITPLFLLELLRISRETPNKSLIF